MRLYTLVLSIVAHAAILIVLVIVPLVAMDVLPGARGIKEFIRADAAELPEPPPPPPARTLPHSAGPVDPGAAPIAAPDRIEPETPLAGPPAIEGPPGMEVGLPSGGGLPGGPPPAVPVRTANAPVRPGGHIRPPQKTTHVAPVYPAIARANKIQGIVILEAVIAENGRVRNVRVLRSIPLLNDAAVDAVRQWVFTPTLLNGEPVPVVMTVTVAFELK